MSRDTVVDNKWWKYDSGINDGRTFSEIKQTRPLLKEVFPSFDAENLADELCSLPNASKKDEQWEEIKPAYLHVREHECNIASVKSNEPITRN